MSDCTSTHDRPSFRHSAPRNETRIAPLFVMSGVSSFLPFAGKQHLYLYEPRYIRMHEDLVRQASSDNMSPPRPCMVAVHKSGTGTISSIGVLLELLGWRHVGIEPTTRIAATYGAGSRVVVFHAWDCDDSKSNTTYLNAEIEHLDDSPGFDAHREVREAWQNLWRVLGKLVELQRQLKQGPSLSRAALELGQKSGVLSAADVWCPVVLLQELYLRQASAAHRKFGEQISRASDEGNLVDGLQLAYKAELDRVKLALEQFPAMLQLDSMVDILLEASEIANSEVDRLKLLLDGAME